MEDFFFYHPIITLVGVTGLMAVFGGFCSCFYWNIGEKTYTGYIYSAEDSYTKTVGQIRFSQNAGTDEQPSFCVKKEHGDNIRKYAGTDTKVKVTIPTGIAVAFPWDCPIEAVVEPFEN